MEKACLLVDGFECGGTVAEVDSSGWEDGWNDEEEAIDLEGVVSA